MPQRQSLPPLIAVVALLAVLTGCDAIYDDTKGWANRLEASLLKTAKELGENPEQDSADAYSPEQPAERRAPQGATASPPAAMRDDPAPAAVVTPPSGVVAAAAADLAAEEEKPAKAEASPTAQEAKPPSPPKAKPTPKKADGAADTPQPPQQDMAAKASEKSELATTKPATGTAPEPKASGPKAAEVKDTKAKDADVATVLHLASLRSERAATREWDDLQRSFAEPLRGLKAEIRRTDLGDKGVFYRVLAGPLPSRDAAQEVCGAVKASNARQYCRVLPAKPKG